MPTHKYQFTVAPEQQEILLAFLSQMPFDSFEEGEGELNAYLAANQMNEDFEAQLIDLQKDMSFSFDSEIVEDKNWNELWEANFRPIAVNDFCGIRADFHEPMPKMRYEILINPRMAFGTGHHETTFMMIQGMEKVAFTGQKVLDYGCGTGVLAILAAKMGANPIQAVDIERPAYENTIDNCLINQTPQIQSFEGQLDAIQDTDFDIILANINRNVILQSLPALYQKLRPGGFLLCSGFIIDDLPKMTKAFADQQLEIIQRQQKNNWLCMTLKRAV